MLKKIAPDFLLPSVAFTIKRSMVKYYKAVGNTKPKMGDMVYCEVIKLGQHNSLENKSGRIHSIHNSSRFIGVFGNRYAADYYEGMVPDKDFKEVDLMARSGLLGKVISKSPMVVDPTRVRVIGYVCDKNNKTINTTDYSLIKPKKTEKKWPRAKMILVCGTSMNSGKSTAAFSACRTLKNFGHTVRAVKVTGTASLKDILGMNDAGAKQVADFTYLGYPSTYLLPKKDLLNIFNTLDLKYANNPKKYFVVEFADGINQRETALLLQNEDVRKRIHRLIFCASDAFGAVGGLKILEENFKLKPDAISGICSSSPLHMKEIKDFSNVPMFNSMNPNMEVLIEILK